MNKETQRMPRVRSTQQAQRTSLRRRTKSNWLAWAAVSLVLAGLMVLVTSPLWLPLLRFVIPDRYIAAYAPEPLAAFILRTDPQAELPAPQVVPPVDADELIPPAAEPTAVIDPNSLTPTLPPTLSPSQITPTPTQPGDVVYGIGEEVITDADLSQADVLLQGFNHVYQGWNNCGPATVTTALSYFGSQTTQNDAVAFLKSDPEDRNVRPDELAAYAESLGYEALVRVDGDLDLLKTFLDQGYPVIIEKGFDPEPDRLGWMGHYIVLVGYSESQRTFIAMDSYLGPHKAYPYSVVEEFWQHFNRLYMVAYPSTDAAQIASIIGEESDDAVMWQNAIYTAQYEISLNRDDAFAWFNLGSSLAALGHHAEAETAFDQARTIGLPWRMLWYQYGPYETYLQVGGERLTDVIVLADAILVDNPYSEEAYYYKGLALAARGNVEGAREQLGLALRYNTFYEDAQLALNTLGSSS